MWVRLKPKTDIEKEQEEKFLGFARRRISGLLHKSCTSTASLELILASAYRQGVEDAVLVSRE